LIKNAEEGSHGAHRTLQNGSAVANHRASPCGKNWMRSDWLAITLSRRRFIASCALQELLLAYLIKCNIYSEINIC